VKFFARTDKPSFWQVWGIEVAVIRAPLFVTGLLTMGGTLNPIAFLAAIALTVAGVKNIQGARHWQWMFDHPGQKLPVMTTVWTKFIGFWG
jgi:hypothetical protein